MSKCIKLAFGFERRAGKDTSCDYLIQKYGGVKLSFAEPLYQILNYAQDVCGFEHSKDRKFLQYIGTEWARTINDDVWVDLLIKKVNGLSNHSNIFVSDLRFKNEFKVLKSLGFICVRIKGKVSDNLDGWNNHQSDLELQNFDGWDFTISNDSTLDDLYGQLDALFSVIHCGTDNPSE
jgi:hypothetical protein